MAPIIKILILSCGAMVTMWTHGQWSELYPWKPAAVVWSLIGDALVPDPCTVSTCTSWQDLLGPHEWDSQCWNRMAIRLLFYEEGRPHKFRPQKVTKIVFSDSVPVLQFLWHVPGSSCCHPSIGIYIHYLVLLTFPPCVHIIAHFLNLIWRNKGIISVM